MNINETSLDELLGECGSQKEPDSGEKLLPPVEDLQRLGIRELWGKDNFKAPAYVNKKEKYEHRVIAYLKATGLNNTEVARQLGLSPVTVNYIVRQPYMESLILEEIKRHADPALQLLANEALGSAERLIALAKTAKNEETKRKANNDILDRKYGKPNQPMTVSNKAASDMSDDELMRIIDSATVTAN